MKASWRRVEDVFRLCLQKTSSRRLHQDEYIRFTHTSSEKVLIKTNIFVLVVRLQYVFKTFSRCLQDVFIKRNIFTLLTSSEDVLNKTNIFVLVIRLQDVFKTSCKLVFKTSSRRLAKRFSRRLQNVFKMSCKNVFKTSSRPFQDVSSN